MFQLTLRPFAAVALMALAYSALALGNEWLLASTQYGKGVHWVYVPAGLRLTFVLIMPWAGALGISLAAFVMALRDPELTMALAALNGAVTGIAPVLARQVAVTRMGLSDDLSELNWLKLIKLCVLLVCSVPPATRLFLPGWGEMRGCLQAPSRCSWVTPWARSCACT